jgi:hypothetical protein
MSLHYLVSWLAGATLACYVIREVKNVYREYPKIAFEQPTSGAGADHTHKIATARWQKNRSETRSFRHQVCDYLGSSWR